MRIQIVMGALAVVGCSSGATSTTGASTGSTSAASTGPATTSAASTASAGTTTSTSTGTAAASSAAASTGAAAGTTSGATSGAVAGTGSSSGTTGSSSGNTDGGIVMVGTGEYGQFFLAGGVLYSQGAINERGAGPSASSTPFPLTKVLIPSNLSVVDVAGGLHTGVAIDNTGHVWEWGDTNSSVDAGISFNPIEISTDSQGNDFGNVVSVRASTLAYAALKGDGTVWIWGDCAGGETGNGVADSGYVFSPVQVSIPLATGVTIKKVLLSDIVLALATDGTVWSWGSADTYEDLGTGNMDYTTPHQLTGLPGGIADIVVGGGFSYALAANGDLYGWGYLGEYLGLGDAGNYYQPTPLPIAMSTLFTLPKPIAAIAASNETTHVILSDGTLWGWGSDVQGEVGDGVETDWATANPPYAWSFAKDELMVSRPVQIAPSITTWKTLYQSPSFAFYTFAQTQDGTLYSWGRNKGGTLGNGVWCPNPNIVASYPNSWDVTVPSVVTPLVGVDVPTNSPYCATSPNTYPCDGGI